MYLTSTGLGIANSSPQEKLQITGNITFGNRSDGASRYIGKGTNGSGGVIGDASANANSCWIGFVLDQELELKTNSDLVLLNLEPVVERE